LRYEIGKPGVINPTSWVSIDGHDTAQLGSVTDGAMAVEDTAADRFTSFLRFLHFASFACFFGFLLLPSFPTFLLSFLHNSGSSKAKEEVEDATWRDELTVGCMVDSLSENGMWYQAVVARIYGPSEEVPMSTKPSGPPQTKPPGLMDLATITNPSNDDADIVLQDGMKVAVVFLGLPDSHDQILHVQSPRLAATNTKSKGLRGPAPLRSAVIQLLRVLEAEDPADEAAVYRPLLATSSLLVDNINYFAAQGGFKGLMRILEQQGGLLKPPIPSVSGEAAKALKLPSGAQHPLEALGLICRCVGKVARVLTRNFALQMLPGICKFIEYSVANLDTPHIRELSKDRVESFVAGVRQMAERGPNSTDGRGHHARAELLLLELSRTCASSPFLNRRIDGLKMIVDIVRALPVAESGSTVSIVAPESSICWVTAAHMTRWINEHKIVENIFVGNLSHEQLMTRSGDIVGFLARHDALSTSQVTIIWDAAMLGASHEEKTIVSQLLKNVCKYFSSDVVSLLVDKLTTRLEVKDMDQLAYELLQEFCTTLLENERKKQLTGAEPATAPGPGFDASGRRSPRRSPDPHKGSTAVAPTPAHPVQTAVLFLWGLIQDSGRLEDGERRKLAQAHLCSILRSHQSHHFAHHRQSRDDILERCLENVVRNVSVPQSLAVFQSLLRDCMAEMGSIAGTGNAGLSGCAGATEDSQQQSQSRSAKQEHLADIQGRMLHKLVANVTTFKDEATAIVLAASGTDAAIEAESGYHILAPEAASQKHSTVLDTWLRGQRSKMAFHEHIADRLVALEFILMNSDFTLTAEHVVGLWQALHMRALTSKERTAFHSWLTCAVQALQTADDLKAAEVLAITEAEDIAAITAEQSKPPIDVDMHAGTDDDDKPDLDLLACAVELSKSTASVTTAPSATATTVPGPLHQASIFFEDAVVAALFHNWMGKTAYLCGRALCRHGLSCTVEFLKRVNLTSGNLVMTPGARAGSGVLSTSSLRARFPAASQNVAHAGGFHMFAAMMDAAAASGPGSILPCAKVFAGSFILAFCFLHDFLTSYSLLLYRSRIMLLM
jgi:hypothetical protein